MRPAVTAVTCFCLMPVLAHAQERIPEPVSRQIRGTCLAACTQARSAEFCTRVCDRATAELQQGWTMDEVRDGAALLSRGQRGAGAVRDRIGGVATRCAGRIG